ncbi:MAG: hypothetical protein O7E52_12070 [Candidatus Poribacteria bacterium]|nr:hypothetical protein [Candidatus Poribacteria bacterium]
MVRTPFLWGVVLVLFFGLVVQLSMWREKHETKKRLSRPEQITSILEAHRQFNREIDDANDRRQWLERAMLWGQPAQILPVLGKAANRLSVKLVGVEELSPKSSAGYQSLPLHLTFSGDYAGFSALLGVVEKIIPPIRIDGVRLYQRQRYPDTLWMSFIVAPMHREDAGERRREIEMPASAPLRIERDPFALRVDAVPTTPMPAPSNEGNLVRFVVHFPRQYWQRQTRRHVASDL